jgi:hypothetical protein
MMQPGAVAIAAENERTRPLLQHIGEIFRTHHRRHLANVGVAGNFLRDPRCKIRLRGMIDHDRIAAFVVQIDFRAGHLRHPGDNLAHPPLDQFPHLRRQGTNGAFQLCGLRYDIACIAGVELADRNNRRFQRVDAA